MAIGKWADKVKQWQAQGILTAWQTKCLRAIPMWPLPVAQQPRAAPAKSPPPYTPPSAPPLAAPVNEKTRLL